MTSAFCYSRHASENKVIICESNCWVLLLCHFGVIDVINLRNCCGILKCVKNGLSLISPLPSWVTKECLFRLVILCCDLTGSARSSHRAGWIMTLIRESKQVSHWSRSTFCHLEQFYIAKMSSGTFVDRIDPFAKRSLKKKTKKSQGSSRYRNTQDVELQALPLLKGDAPSLPQPAPAPRPPRPAASILLTAHTTHTHSLIPSVLPDSTTCCSDPVYVIDINN